MMVRTSTTWATGTVLIRLLCGLRAGWNLPHRGRYGVVISTLCRGISKGKCCPHQYGVIVQL